MDIKFDGSELKDLAGMLDRARARPHKERAQALDKTVRKVEAEATANALSFTTDSTGELARSIQTDGTPVSRRVYSDVRQAFFLEFGSPNTGAPRPWLTGPAQEGADDLLEELAKSGDIW